MAEPAQTSELARAVQDVTERAQVIVREEIELAKAEITLKTKKLVRGAAVGAAAGVFVAAAVIYLLHGLSWFFYDMLRGIEDEGADNFWLGFLITTGILFLLAAVAGYIAVRLLRTGPPTPDMAIQEAQLIRETVSGHPEGSRA